MSKDNRPMGDLKRHSWCGHCDAKVDRIATLEARLALAEKVVEKARHVFPLNSNRWPPSLKDAIDAYDAALPPKEDNDG